MQHNEGQPPHRILGVDDQHPRRSRPLQASLHLYSHWPPSQQDHSAAPGVVMGDPVDPIGYWPSFPPPPPLPLNLLRLPDDNESLVEATAMLQDLVRAFQDPSRRDALQDIPLFEFQRALIEGLSIFASSGLLDHSLDWAPFGSERRQAVLRLHDMLSHVRSPDPALLLPISSVTHCPEPDHI
jgi:hypothetical protein